MLSAAAAALVATEGVVDPAQNFVATAATGEVFTAGSGSDTVTGTLAAMTGDYYHLGQGTDTLVLTDHLLSIGAADLPTMSGVDVIDVTAAGHIGTIVITDALVRQSDAGVLTLKTGAQDVHTLSAGLTDPGLTLVVEGAGGIVHLANNTYNVITAADDNTSEIVGGNWSNVFHGGTGADIFHRRPERRSVRPRRQHQRRGGRNPQFHAGPGRRPGYFQAAGGVRSG